MAKLLLPILGASIVLAAGADAQSINVDFGPLNSGYGVPSPNYGGSAGAPGLWNPVSSTSVTNLRSWDGAETNVSLSTTSTLGGCGGLFHTSNVPGTSGMDERLLDDRYSADDFDVVWTFQGLASGTYVVDTIIVEPNNMCLFRSLGVEVIGSTDPIQYVGGEWSGSYAQGETFVPSSLLTNYARHSVTVTNGTLEVKVFVAEKPHDYVRVCAIQLNLGEQDSIGTFQCPGDYMAACPCGNSGFTWLGCQNSAGTGGAFLRATGTTTPDTVVLRATGEMPTAVTIFLQGNAAIDPVAFGDGLRCVGGILKRLYTKNASGGAAIAPAGAEPSITARSAALGDPILAGDRRYYMTYYRDGNPTFCPLPTGNSFNASNAVKIVWN